MGEYYDFGGLSMNVKSDEERKSKVLKVRLNDKEFAKLKQYTEESGLRSMSEYILPSILTPNDRSGTEYFKAERQKRGELDRKTSG